jgi:ubiquinone/menaquinone biosynthesis C-methylase UbiE
MDDFGPEPFSQEPEYRELNRSFIQSILPYLGRKQLILDLACGTGMLEELLLDELQTAGIRVPTRATRVLSVAALGVDISRESLKVAQKYFREAFPQTIIEFVEASADVLPIASSAVDLTLMGNAIHLLFDKNALVQQVYRVLRPGGFFAFNTCFYAGTFIPGTEEFYHRWMIASLEYIRQKDQEARRAGMAGIVRVRGRGKPAFSNRWLSPEEYVQLLERHGFEVKNVDERVCDMFQKDFENAGSYPGLASVLLNGYPIPVACEALKQSVKLALAKVGTEVIHRSWLEVIAVKR